MAKYEKNLEEFLDSYRNFSLLECEQDSEFLEWYSMEGSKRISELSRQLRTFLNYKSTIIRLRYSKSRESNNSLKLEPIMTVEKELLSLSSRYVVLQKMIGLEDKSVTQKILVLIERAKIKLNNFEINLLKEIKQLGSEIWKKLHIISELKIHNRPQLLNIAIQIASILSSAENAFFWPFSNFYEELKLSYLQLEGELSGLLQVIEDEQFNFKKKVKQVRILE